jgi:hypothetical protein
MMREQDAGKAVEIEQSLEPIAGSYSVLPMDVNTFAPGPG